MPSFHLRFLVALATVASVLSFPAPSILSNTLVAPPLRSGVLPTATVLRAVNEDGDGGANKKEDSRLFQEFRTANGEVIDPYRVLKVSKSATREEIRASYRKLSRKLHPDRAARTNILPGNCENLDEVRDEWEKAKLSYEILYDKRMKFKYDRNSAINDPGPAAARAAMGAIGWGLGGAWKLTEAAVKITASTASSVVASASSGGSGRRDK